MTIREIWVDETVDGRPLVSIWTWAEKTLNEKELEEFRAAEAKQIKYRQEAIDRGDLILDGSYYVWRDQAAFDRHKEVDDIWVNYFLRWRHECGINDGRKISKDEE